MAAGRHRRKHTVAQAKNLMHRAVDEIVDPSPRNVDPLWKYFGGRCAYCGKELDRDEREGHVDHAVAGGDNHLGNLVLACGVCNGDEKREESWREFLRKKTPDDAAFSIREGRILAWFELHSRPPTVDSPEVARVRAQIDELIEQFAVKCSELKKLVNDRNSAR